MYFPFLALLLISFFARTDPPRTALLAADSASVIFIIWLLIIHSLPIHHHEEKRFNACFSPYSNGFTKDKGFKMVELKSWRAVLPLIRTLGCPTGLWRADC